MVRPHTPETIGNDPESIGSREAYYIDASLDTDPLFCGDDRNRDGIQLFGGIVNIAYNQAVLQEALSPGSVTDSLQGRAEALTTALIENGAHPGVHSDTKAEKGSELRDELEGPVGCAYADKRGPISRRITVLGEELVEEAERLRPELFERHGDREFAIAVMKAHNRLAEREGFQASGRELVLGAATKGAEVAVLEGEHIASDGVLNLVPNTTFDSGAADEEGLPAYNHDAWAAEDIASRLGDSSDPNQRQIVNLIDALGTMSALGVEAIAVRR